MKKALEILGLLVKRWASKSPKLFVVFQWIATIVVIIAGIVILIPTAPAWLTTLATLLVAFFSGWGVSSKFTTTDETLK